MSIRQIRCAHVRRMLVAAVALLGVALAAAPASSLPGPVGGAGPAAQYHHAAPVDSALRRAVSSGPTTFLVQLANPHVAASVDSSFVRGGIQGPARRTPLAYSTAHARGARRAEVVRRILADGDNRLAGLDGLLQALQAQGHVSEVERFRAAGIVAVTGDEVAAEGLAAVPGVVRVRANRRHSLPGTHHTDGYHAEVGWNLTAVRAEQAWQRLGLTGEGVVVATIDTGVDWSHPALRMQYRGHNGDHDYNWFDVASHGAALRRPVDPHGHGTHVTGLISGRDGPRAYGVAPGAEWIAVRAFDGSGITTDLRLLRAAEWVLAPTDLDGRTPRPDLAPDVVNCSWTLENTADPLFEVMIDAWRAAGILPVFAAGNDDDGTGTLAGVRAPGSDPDAIAVGALTPWGDVWARSRGGPGFYGGLKPDLIAPGVLVESSVPGGGTARADGTSMAAPHVSGAAALLLSAAPHLTVEDLSAFLLATARDAGPSGPDTRYGWGVLDAHAAAARALTAGRLAGRITAGRGPLAGSAIVAASPDGSEQWRGRTDEGGAYDLAVPEGTWEVSASAFGFEPRRRVVGVVDDQVTLLDLALERAATATLGGRVTSAVGQALPEAAVAVVGHDLVALTDAEGSYTMALPAGRHTVRASAAGHRDVTATLSVEPPAERRQDFELANAPRLLVVDAESYDQERIHPYVARALSDAGYAFDLWQIGDPQRSPDAAALAPYDVVLWMHLYGSPGRLDALRGDRQVTEALERYLGAGGRLLLSGQDVGLRDSAEGPLSSRLAPEFYRRVLGARWLADRAPIGPLTGVGPLAGLSLTLDWPLGHPKGARQAPDAVAPASGPEGAGVAPVLLYSDGRAAALAASDGVGRRMYLAFGPESAGARVALAVLLDRSIAWLEPPQLSLVAEPELLAPGEAARMTLAIRAGRAAIPVKLGVNGSRPLDLDPGPDGLERGGAGGLSWSGSLAPGEGQTFRFAARLTGPWPGGQPLPVTATLRAHGSTITGTTALRSLTPDLAPSTLSVAPRRLVVGGPVTATLRLVNRGPVTAAGATTVIELPAAMGVISDSLSATSGQVTWESGDGRARWLGDLAPGVPVTVTLGGRLPPGLGTHHLLSATLLDGAGGLVTRRAAVLVGGPDLSLSRLDPAARTVLAGERLTVSLTVRNEGLLAAEASAVLALPPDVEARGGSSLTHDPAARYLTWRGRVSANGQTVVRFPLRVSAGAKGQRPVTVTLTDGFVPEVPLRLVGVLKVERPDLAASRTVLLSTRPRSGEVVTATVLVGNHGDAPAKVDARCFLPSAVVVEAESVRSSGGRIELSPGVVRWSVDVSPASGAFTWTESSAPVRTGGVPVRLPPDPESGARGPVDLGLLFPFDTAAYTQTWVTDDGLLTFLPPEPVAEPALGPGGPGVPAIAPLWRSGRLAQPPLVRRGAAGVTITWPAAQLDEAFAVVLDPSGDVRLAYGAGVDAAGAVIGLQFADESTLLVPPDQVPPGRSLAVNSPGGWEWLTFGAHLGMSLGPNSTVTHTVELSAGGLTYSRAAAVVANRLRLDQSTLEVEPVTPIAGGVVGGRLILLAEGDVEARGVAARVSLPDAADLVPGSTSGGLRLDATTGELVWSGRLRPDERHILSWRARLSPVLEVGARLLTRAGIRAPGLAPLDLAQAQTVRATDFTGSRKWAWRPVALPGEVVTFTLRVVNAGSDPAAAEVTDALAPGLELAPGALFASRGPAPQWDPSSRSLRWAGELPGASAVEILVGTRYLGPGTVINVMHVGDGEGTNFAAWAEVSRAVSRAFLPVAWRAE